MNVLVTGACGLLGTELCLQLRAAGHGVIGVDNLSRYELLGETGPRDQRENAKMVRESGVDLRIDDFRHVGVGGADAVVHAAAQVCHSRKGKFDNPIDDVNTNVVGTVDLLQLAAVKKLPFLFISSAKLYGEAKVSLLTEQTPIGDQTHLTFFGASKAAADLFAQMYARKYDFPVGVFRPGCFTGRWALATEAQNWLPWLVHCVRTGTTFNLFGDGTQVRDLLHAADLARACLSWLGNPKAGVWNLGGGIARSEPLAASINRVETLLGRRTVMQYHPKRAGDIDTLVMCNDKFEADYDWSPGFALEDIFKEACEEVQQREVQQHA